MFDTSERKLICIFDDLISQFGFSSGDGDGAAVYNRQLDIDMIHGLLRNFPNVERTLWMVVIVSITIIIIM